MSEDWVGGTYESGSDDGAQEPIEPAGSDETEGDIELGFGEGSEPDLEENIEP
jgi:hypothetical protein